MVCTPETKNLGHLPPNHSSMLLLRTYDAYFTNIYIPTFIYKEDCGIEIDMQHSFQ